ncbi:HAD-IIIA family hydrolase [Candidatus Pacearchaeota archaeon]|nr:HAD-IIIA family hydrolase [Candidatus Pacearchaeota archaeon]
MLPVKNLNTYNLENIISSDKAFKLIKKFKEGGKTIGLCHGGFDLLHPGQVKHLESAKNLCDILFVSITSDKFVTCRKGSGRPIFNDVLRAYMVGNLKFVDYVVITDYKLGVDVIDKLKPTYYIKGPDFINKKTPGIDSERQKIKDVGGEIKYTNDSKLSTTEIIDYIKNKVDKNRLLLCIDRDGTLIEEQNFLGKDKGWENKIKIKENIISTISYLQTKYQTTKIVISNQAGVARGYFTCNTVNKINNYIDHLLEKRGIKIDAWEYCPYVDSAYAESKKNEIKFDTNFVKDKTKRKPNGQMMLDGLQKLGRDISDFSQIIIFGDMAEDQMLAKKLNAIYIDASIEYNKAIEKVDF